MGKYSIMLAIVIAVLVAIFSINIYITFLPDGFSIKDKNVWRLFGYENENFSNGSTIPHELHINVMSSHDVSWKKYWKIIRFLYQFLPQGQHSLDCVARVFYIEFYLNLIS